MKVGVNVAIIHNNQLLLTKRNDFEVWCLPGGHMDAGETVAEAAVREVKEETGLDIRLTQFVGVYSIPDANAWVNLMLSFTGEVIGGALKAQESEVLEMAYFPFDAIPNNLLWGHHQRIQDAINGQVGVVWRQNVPFDPVENRQELYDLLNESGLTGKDFYAQNFGWTAPDADQSELL